jgi:hypothetical protein
MSPAKQKPSPNARSQGTISSYFTQSSPLRPKANKRGASPLCLTDDETGGLSDVHVSKKHKLSAWSYVSDTQNAVAGPSCPRPSTTVADEKSPPFSLTSSHAHLESLKTRRAPDNAASKNRREASKKGLLKENSSLFRSRSNIESDTPVMDVDEGDQSINQTVELDVTSGDESDEAFKNLRTMFSNPQAQRKATAPRQRKQKPQIPAASKKPDAVEDTPSGQPYTPFEKQVSSSSVSFARPSSMYPGSEAEGGQSWDITHGRSWIQI